MKIFIPIAALLVAGASADFSADVDNGLKVQEPMSVEEFDNIFTNFAHILTHFGHDGLEFLRCLGPTFLGKCRHEVVGCGLSHSPVACWGLLKCEGVPAASCIHHIKEEHQHEHDAQNTTPKH